MVGTFGQLGLMSLPARCRSGCVQHSDVRLMNHARMLYCSGCAAVTCVVGYCDVSHQSWGLSRLLPATEAHVQASVRAGVILPAMQKHHIAGTMVRPDHGFSV